MEDWSSCREDWRLATLVERDIFYFAFALEDCGAVIS